MVRGRPQDESASVLLTNVYTLLAISSISVLTTHLLYYTYY